MWEPPAPADAVTIAAALRGHGARPWQVALTAAAIAAALPDPDAAQRARARRQLNASGPRRCGSG